MIIVLAAAVWPRSDVVGEVEALLCDADGEAPAAVLRRPGRCP
jgi:hypothetical protein